MTVGLERRVQLALLIGVASVSTAATLFKLSEAGPLVKVFYRLFFAVLLLLPMLFLWERGRWPKLSPRIVGLLLLGGLVLAGHFGLWVASLDLTSVTSSVVLVTAHPVLVALASAVLLHEPPGRRTLFGIGLGLAGVAVIALADLGEGRDSLLGDLLAGSAGVLAAVYLLIGRTLRPVVPVLRYSTTVYSLCLLWLLGPILILNEPLLSPGVGSDWPIFLGLAVGPTILGHTLLNYTLKYVQATLVSASLIAEPIGASLIAAAILGEVPTTLVVAGAGLALAGIYAVATAPEHRRLGLPEPPG